MASLNAQLYQARDPGVQDWVRDGSAGMGLAGLAGVTDRVFAIHCTLTQSQPSSTLGHALPAGPARTSMCAELILCLLGRCGALAACVHHEQRLRRATATTEHEITLT